MGAERLGRFVLRLNLHWIREEIQPLLLCAKVSLLRCDVADTVLDS
jgi:hypothetical protein